jgi:folate-binding protein YgfZ
MTLSEKFQAARGGLAVGPLRPRTLLHAGGPDARAYLHRMLTQDVKGLPPGGGAHFALLTVKGHLVAEGQILILPDGVLLDLDPAAAPELRALLESRVIMDDVSFEDRSVAWRVLPLLGPGAEAAADAHGAGLSRWVNRRRGAPGLDLLAPAERAETLRAGLVAGGAVALDEADLEALRIAGGVARWGADLDGSRLPMEAGLAADAISFTKGCYPGQEVVVRATTRGQVQRGLVLLRLPEGAGPGSRLVAAGAEVGQVTSAAPSPEGRRGLGYLRRACWATGTRLATDGGEAEVIRALAGEQEQPARPPP